MQWIGWQSCLDLGWRSIGIVEELTRLLEMPQIDIMRGSNKGGCNARRIQ